MNETTADNRPDPLATDSTDPTNPTNPTDTNDTLDPLDPLDRIADEIDGVTELDPAEAVDVLAAITDQLNEELDADTERS